MKKALFIDDDEVNNFLMENKMETHMPDVEAIFFDSAPSALDYLEKNPESPPDVIFLDVKMPGMKGFDFLDEYHSRKYHESFPTRIFMLSSSVKASDREKSKDYISVKGFISKPLGLDELKKIKEQS